MGREPDTEVVSVTQETTEEKKFKKPKKRSLWKRILLWLGIVIGAVVLFAVAGLTYLTLTEYRPADRETLTVTPPVGAKDGAQESADKTTLPAAPTETLITLMTWNIGYGALGDNADFFMDGGSGVYTADEKRVRDNLTEMYAKIGEVKPDILLVQEIDEDSSRSYGINEIEQLHEFLNRIGNGAYQSTFAYNFKAKYVPYPIPPVGRVNSGIQTLSKYRITSAERVKLPTPFKWPIRIANLKRCLAVQRIPVDGSGHELVLINLHLEAYDSGEGKIEQTKILKGILEEEAAKGNYVIAGGDFNQTFSDADVSAYPQQDGKWVAGKIDVTEYGEGLTFHTDTSAPTCRSLDQPLAGADRETFQFYVLDGFVVSSNVEVLSVKTIDLAFHATDHNPVVMEVKLRKDTE